MGQPRQTEVCLVILILSLCMWKTVSQLTFPNNEFEEESDLPEMIRIGGLFDESDPMEETAFKHAVHRVNADLTIMPKTRLTTQIETLSFGDSYHASEKVCDMMRDGVAAIFGPQSPESASHVQSICDAFEIPHIETKWDFKIRKENYLINLYPHPMTLSRAYSDLVEAFGWTEFVIIYENDESLFTIQDILKTSNPPAKRVLVKQLPVGDDYRELLNHILYSTSLVNIVIDCTTEKVPIIFKQAQQVGLMTFKYSYIVTTLDMHTLDLQDFAYGGTNITAFRIVDPERPEVESIVKEWNSLMSVDVDPYSDFSRTLHKERYHSNVQGYMPVVRTNLNRNKMMPYMEENEEEPEAEPVAEVKMITTATALVYDSVYLLGKALHALDSSQMIEINGIDCDSKDTWQHGYSIINYMKMIQMQGLTGLIQFDPSGYRTYMQMDVIQLQPEGLHKIGIWDSKFVTKFNWSRPDNHHEEVVPAKDEPIVDISNRTLTVTTIMNKPFMMYKLSTMALPENEQFEGFTVDLLAALSRVVGCKFQIKIVSDGSYGSLVDRAKGKWNGMIREVIEGEADIAVADLSVNKDRQNAVDFTMPFMNLGISILFVEPSKKAPELFSFMSPFSEDVWVHMFYAVFGFSIFVYIIARITPIEWEPHPCIADPEELENQYTLLNTFWFTIGALMGQGSDIAPKATSTRLAAGIWFFFVLIIVSSYTANLAAFLVAQELDEPIKSLVDLQDQDVVKYGCVGGGSTAAFFKNSPFPERREMWKNMETWNAQTPGILPRNNAAGVDRVLEDKGKYAFFMESTVIEYNVERVCGLYQVGGFLDNKGYAIGMRKGSLYRQQLNGGILQLQEGGVLDKLKRKWWQEERKSAGCPEEEESSALGMQHVGGVFVLLVAGCIVAFVIACMEFLWENRKNAAEQTDSGASGSVLAEMMKEELKFALGSLDNAKPVSKQEKKDSVSIKGSDSGGSGDGDPEGSDQNLDLESYGLANSATPHANKKSSKDSSDSDV